MEHPERFFMAGVMGWPVLHSRSPILHNYWLKAHQLHGTYVPLEIKIENLSSALRALPALRFSGCNLTIPHKVEALKILDRVDPLAARIGAANCVVVEEDGSLTGYNNDGWGYIENIKASMPHWRADAGPIVLVGAGGGARAVAVALLDQGATEIRLVNRTQARGDALAAHVGAGIHVINWDERAAALDGAAMLINTTNQGMIGQPALDLALDRLPIDALVSDIIYTPLVTPLLAAARARGNPTVDGLGMLLHQARPAFKAWFGIMPQVTDELRRKIEATL